MGRHQRLLPKNAGADLSGMVAGTSFLKESDNSLQLVVLDGSQANLSEASNKEALADFLIQQKPDTDTYIRFCYTAGAAINITIAFAVQAYVSGSNNLEAI